MYLKVMKKRSTLNKQTVKKRKKRKNGFRLFSMICLVSPVLFKSLIVLVAVSTISYSLIYCYHYLATTPHLTLERVVVTGVNEEIKRELIDMCNFASDSNILFINLNKLKRKMEKHPWIKSVRLKRCFPHTLIVQAEKHAPTALVVMDKTYYMNQICEVFKEVNSSDDVDFPVITGVSKEDPKALEHLNRAAHIIGILENQRKPWSLKELSEIHVKEEKITLYFSHLSAEINVMCHDLSFQMNGLRKIIKHLRETGRIHQVTGIDLNIIDGAVVSFEKG